MAAREPVALNMTSMMAKSESLSTSACTSVMQKLFCVSMISSVESISFLPEADEHGDAQNAIEDGSPHHSPRQLDRGVFQFFAHVCACVLSYGQLTYFIGLLFYLPVQ